MLEYFANITDFPDAIEEKKDFYWIRNKKKQQKTTQPVSKTSIKTTSVQEGFIDR